MNYDDLKAMIQDTLQRGDVAPAVPSWIRLAEARFNRELRVWQMITRATTTAAPGAGSSFVTLPGEWLHAQNVQLNADSSGVRPLTYITLQEADKLRAGGATSGARFYTLHAGQLELVPPLKEEQEVELTYYAKVPALTTDYPTNWLLETWPDLYLYGSLLHSAPYLDNDARLPVWAGMHDKILEEARLQDARAETSGSTPRARIRAIG